MSPQEREHLRGFLASVFVEGFTDADWDHGLGGLHLMAEDEDGRLIGHSCIVQRHLMVGPQRTPRRVGYIEGVAVDAAARGQGLASSMVAEINEIITRSYDFGALCATEQGLPVYQRAGWKVWRGPLWAATPEGIVATDEDRGAVMVYENDSVALDLDTDLTADWRIGDVW